MSFEDSEIFKLYDKQNIEHNKKLKRKSDFNDIIKDILNSKFENIKERCKANDENIPRLETIENVYEEVEERGMKCCYCGITMVHYVDSPTSYEREKDEKFKFIATIEHKTPLSRGGNNTKQNIDFSCLCCNVVKDSMLDEEYKNLISKLSYDDLMNLYKSRIDLNRFITSRIEDTRELRKDNNKYERKIKELEDLNKRIDSDLKKRNNTITQLKDNLDIVKRENTMIRKEIEDNEYNSNSFETIDDLKDSIIMQLKEQNKLLRNLNSSEMRLKYLEVSLEKVSNGKNTNAKK